MRSVFLWSDSNETSSWTAVLERLPCDSLHLVSPARLCRVSLYPSVCVSVWGKWCWAGLKQGRQPDSPTHTRTHTLDSFSDGLQILRFKQKSLFNLPSLKKKNINLMSPYVAKMTLSLFLSLCTTLSTLMKLFSSSPKPCPNRLAIIKSVCPYAVLINFNNIRD